MSSSSQHSSTNNAFVTLLTSDHYLPGALVLAESLRLSHGLPKRGKARVSAPTRNGSNANFQIVALITPDTLSVQSIKALRRSGLFDWIVGVEPIGFRQILASSSSSSSTPAQLSAGTSTATESRPLFPPILDSELNAKIMEMEKNLVLLGRPDLTNTLTKLHAWRLGRDSTHLVTQGSFSGLDGSSPTWQGFDKLVFLDADTLVLRPIDHLFDFGPQVKFAAAPDTGWPDAFNSGVMMLTPSSDTFEAIRSFARSTGSWDGADQGLLNDFFGPEDGSGDLPDDALSQSAPGGGWKRLSFRYNVTSHGGYTFAPAYQRYGKSINIVHFIGQHKPWNRPRPTGNAQPNPLVGPRDLDSQSITPDQPDYLLALWHNAFASLYPTSGSASPDSEIEIVHTERGVEVVELPRFTLPTYHAVWDAEAREEGAPGYAGKGGYAAGAYERGQHPPAWEASYASLPLDGRSFLIAPSPEVARTPSPPTPTRQSIDAEVRSSGAAATAAPVPIPGRAGNKKGSDDSDNDSPEHFSPPKLSWNPAYEPPPTGPDASLYQMRNPIDAFYSNVWDARQKTPRTLAEQKAAFFVPQQSPNKQKGGRPQGGPGYIPAQLRRDHVFDNLGSAKPDPSKVKPIFPWERQQQTGGAPSRVFPDEPRRPSSPPQQAGSAQTTPKLGSDGQNRVGPATAAAAAAQHSRGLPANLAFVNAWDRDGAIGNFVSLWNRRAQPSPSPEGRRSRAVAEQERAGSRESSSTRQARSGASRQGSPSNTFRPAPLNLGGEQRSSLVVEKDGREGEASDSRDGDDESSDNDESSDKDNENEQPTQSTASTPSTARRSTPPPTISRSGSNRTREGPGKGYMRKAESSVYAQMRSPRMTSRVLSYTSTATEGEGTRSGGAGIGGGGGGRFSPSSSASNSTVTGEARQRARDRIRPDGWISSSSGSGMTSPPKTREMTASTLRGIPGVRPAPPIPASSYPGMGTRRWGENSSNESQSGESGANSPTALLSPSLGVSFSAMPNGSRGVGGMGMRGAVPVPPSLDEPFSSSHMNSRGELTQQLRTHQQAQLAQYNPNLEGRGGRSNRPA
ncbi:related to glycogenin-2 beta [Ustilago sp. UG-2017b]|nr:related to glycogenin-2 beta [Ustilago sp. UG-2017b]